MYMAWKLSYLTFLGYDMLMSAYMTFQDQGPIPLTILKLGLS